jgi:hypothetical protein
MEPQHLFDTLFGVILLLVGAIVKVLWDAVKTLQRDMKTIEVNLPTNYVPKREFRQETQEIKDMLTKIFDKLDGKVDKS